MRILMFFVVLLLGHIALLSQVADRTSETEQIKSIIRNLAAKRSSAHFILRDLADLKGKVTAPTDDFFILKTRGLEGKRIKVRVPYREILEIKSKNISVSFIPDPSSRSFGTWDDVLKIGYNHSLDIVLENGQSITGQLGEITNDNLTLFSHTGNEKLTLIRDQIVYIYRVRHLSNKNGGVTDGANKGARAGQELGPTAFGKVLGAGLGTVAGAIAGTVAGATKNQGTLYLLIYSK